MSNLKAPLKNPKPDINNFLKGIKGEITPGRPLMCEYLIDDALMKPILVDYLGRNWHKTYARQAHYAGRIYLLHSCGKIDDIMDDLINLILFGFGWGVGAILFGIGMDRLGMSLGNGQISVKTNTQTRNQLLLCFQYSAFV